MKKVFSFMLAVLMITAVFALSASAIVGDGYHNYGEIANVERRSIRLDAVKEPVYDAATPIPIEYQSTKNYTTGTKYDITRKNGESVAKGVAYMVYDTQFLWIYVEITDDAINTKAADALSSSHKEDSIEILIDWTNEGKNVDNFGPCRIHLTHEGYIAAKLGQSGTSMKGTAEQGSKVPVNNQLQGTARRTEKGYDCEFKLVIPEDREIGEHISIGFTINDYDSTGKNRIMICADPLRGSNQWAYEELGYIKFNYAPYTGDNTIYYVVAAMVVALAVCGVTVLTLKKRVASK